jgi:hypothetical protein
MKESTLLEMQNKIKALTNVVQHLMGELEYVRTLAIGTMETIKHMDDYEDALGKLKEKSKQEEDGVIEQDSK